MNQTGVPATPGRGPVGRLFSIALRYTFDLRGGYLSGFLSLLSMLGIVLAIALLIIVLSVMNGFDREMRDHILAIVPQLIIKSWVPLDTREQHSEQLLEHPEVVSRLGKRLDIWKDPLPQSYEKLKRARKQDSQLT
jgi:hypothetical protein